MDFLPIRKGQVVDLAVGDDRLKPRHRFEPRQLKAINAALAASRPLLVRGEPGIGKSQLARAAAKALQRAFIQHVVDARTESRDLLWHFDAVGRLAEAQVMGALQTAGLLAVNQNPTDDTELTEQALKSMREYLAIRKFLHPRALWWAFDWESAARQAKIVGADHPPQADGGDPANGCVVLIDEIDKAESDVPNGLLEALGVSRFTPQGCTEPVKAKGPPLLVVITTNEERALPDAFIRRCLVLHLKLPKTRDALIAKLIERGQTHFGGDATHTVLKKAAELLADDRAAADQRHWRPLPGQAEYLDLVRAVVTQSDGDRRLQNRLIGQVAEFVLKKHPEAAQELAEDDA
jgi:MoxR-like ATPase